MKKEFLEFMNDSNQSVPSELAQKVKADIFRKLNPGLKAVFMKSLIVQFLAGLMTLLFCPQFGFGPWGGHYGIMALAMSYGPIVCGMSCGSFFIGTTVLVNQMILKNDELRVFYRSRFKLLPGIWASLILTLMVLGKQFSQSSQLEFDPVFLSAWMVAALVIGFGFVSLMVRGRLRRI